jgi:hypothetical protein
MGQDQQAAAIAQHRLQSNQRLGGLRLDGFHL